MADNMTRKRVRAARIARVKNEPTDAAGAARLFRRRTGIQLKKDPAFGFAVAVALAAALIDTVARLERWAMPIRKTLRKEAEIPTLPAWFERASAVTRNKKRRRPQAEMKFGESANVAPNEKVDLFQTAMQVINQVAELRENLQEIEDTLHSVEQIDRELRAVQADPQGRTGSFIETNPRSRPIDQARLRFARRLDREWRRANRPELQATEIALAAVYAGLDDFTGGQDALVARWATQIRRDIARSKKVLAAEKKRASRQRRNATARGGSLTSVA